MAIRDRGIALVDGLLVTAVTLGLKWVWENHIQGQPDGRVFLFWAGVVVVVFAFVSLLQWQLKPKTSPPADHSLVSGQPSLTGGLSPDDMKDRILKWAHRNQLWVQSRDLGVGHDFNIVVRKDGLTAVTVVKKSNEPWVVFGANQALDHEQIEILRPVASKFREELADGVVRLGLGCQIDPRTGAVEKVLLIHAKELTEATSELEFLEALSLIDRGGKMVGSVVRKLTTELESDPPAP